MAAYQNTAIYLGKDAQLSVRNVKEAYQPKGSQSLIRVQYSAINPADIRHYYMGLSDYVAGYEWMGTVVEKGPSSPFALGQQLFGMALPGNKRPISAGAHQEFLLTEADWAYTVPPNTDPLTVVAFPIAAQTSMDALFNCLGFAFPPAGLTGEDPAGKAILIWGGASALGQSALQLAKAAGFDPILTTASPRNHEALRELGATGCFDYRSHDVVREIRSAVEETGKKLTVVYDTVCAGLGTYDGLSPEELKKVQSEYEKSSPAMARRCCSYDTSLKLCGSLPVERDPDWEFPHPYRLAEGVVTPSSELISGVEFLLEGASSDRGNRIRAVREWVLGDMAKNWKPQPVKTVRGAASGIQAIKEVFEGKVSREKIVIERPL